MAVTIGTFNLNNLFSRYNFQAELDEAPVEGGGITLSLVDNEQYRVRTFMGRLVKAKPDKDTRIIAQRILAMNLDVLAIQEVEHIEILREFNSQYLNGLYPHVALIEGNDRRMIDVGFLSKLPFGAITSHQAVVHPDAPDERVFGRDLASVEILSRDRTRKLFTLYNTHLKSHFVSFPEDPVEGARKANIRRKQQAEMIAAVIGQKERSNTAYVLAGDMNDPPESEFLAPMLTIDGKSLYNALQDAVETRPAKAETEGPGPSSPVWTYRHNPGDGAPDYKLIDQIWLSEKLRPRLLSAHIDRRTRHGGDGGDHDPAWITLAIDS